MPVKKIIVAVLIILVAVGGFVAGLVLLQDNQELREEAAVPGGTATVSLEPATASYDVGDTFTSTVYFNPANVAISGVAVRLRYAYNGAQPEVHTDGSMITINNSLLSSGDWTCPVKTVSEEGTEVVIDIACGNQSESGFVSNQDVKLADIEFEVNSEPASDPLTIRFDSAESIITDKASGQDILLIPSSTGSYTIGATSGPTATTAPTQAASSPTPTTQLTVTPSPTGTISATPTKVVTKGGDELPDAGIGYPTMMGAGFGLLILMGAILLAL